MLAALPVTVFPATPTTLAPNLLAVLVLPPIMLELEPLALLKTPLMTLE